MVNTFYAKLTEFEVQVCSIRFLCRYESEFFVAILYMYLVQKL